ncbi:hypothetical protein ONS96_002065 [Cadophora gregata f. sp. sojae]|nr:hypothetical protein ONS96_002065 [Cadophora gregata f. sp. sojae]
MQQKFACFFFFSIQLCFVRALDLIFNPLSRRGASITTIMRYRTGQAQGMRDCGIEGRENTEQRLLSGEQAGLDKLELLYLTDYCMCLEIPSWIAAAVTIMARREARRSICNKEIRKLPQPLAWKCWR